MIDATPTTPDLHRAYVNGRDASAGVRYTLFTDSPVGMLSATRFVRGTDFETLGPARCDGRALAALHHDLQRQAMEV